MPPLGFNLHFSMTCDFEVFYMFFHHSFVFDETLFLGLLSKVFEKYN